MPAYKDPARNTWYAKFNYRNWKGEIKQACKRGFRTKHDALNYEASFKLRQSGSMEMSFEEFIKVYRENHSKRIRPSTLVTKTIVIEEKILPYFKHFKMSEIKASDILNWQNELLSYKNPRTGKPYSDTYLRKVHSEMSAIMNYAVKYYDLKDNPAKKAGCIGKDNKEDIQFWTPDEYKRFSEAIMDDIVHYYCFEVLYWTGIREGELLALTIDDIDLDAKTLNINKTFQIINGNEHVGPAKTVKSNRTVSLPDTLCDELRDYFELCPDYIDSNRRVFPTTKSNLSRCMKRGCKSSGVKRIRIHDLRHSHISLLLNMGYTPVDIAKRVGHESITITLRYAHSFPGVQKQMTDKLNNMMEDRHYV